MPAELSHVPVNKTFRTLRYCNHDLSWHAVAGKGTCCQRFWQRELQCWHNLCINLSGQATHTNQRRFSVRDGSRERQEQVPGFKAHPGWQRRY
jgi:hypothetical protein